MCEQLSLLPLTHQFDKDGFMKDTTYWEIEERKEGDIYLVFNKDYYAMLLPKDNFDWLCEIIKAETVVITKGSYNGKKDCFEIMFIDEAKAPYTMILENEQFERVTPLKEGWHGRFEIFTGGLYNCKNYFDKVYYRVAGTLPFGKPVGE